MAGLTPLPPTIVHSSTRLTHAEAHARLSEFLKKAEKDPAYHPNSTLTDRGPQSTDTGANPNLKLHHLHRILKGMEGKRLGGNDVGKFFGEGVNEVKAKKGKSDRAGKKSGKKQGLGPGVTVEPEQDEWQDKEDYDLAQDVVGPNVTGEERHPGAHLEEPADDQEAEEMAEIEIEGTGRKVGLLEQRSSKSTVSKEERKESKKARRRERAQAKKHAQG